MPGTTLYGQKQLRRLGRGVSICAIVVVLLLLVVCNTARAFNAYQDIFVTLSARPLGMGGAFAALSGPESVFYNPAGLASMRTFRLLHNHSARHFPGSTEGGMSEWDQLDGDTQAIVVPLPGMTYSHGFTFSGEMGYDYRGHPADGSLGYPREQYWGTESYDALGFSGGLPLGVGIALRRQLGRFTPADDDSTTPAWIRIGEGLQWGVLARVWPSVDLGYSELKMDYDWTVLPRAGFEAQSALPTMESRLKQKRTGWALHPTGWLTLATDAVTENWRYSDDEYAGLLHLGNSTVTRVHTGGELCLGSVAKLRWGNYDGHPTTGLAFNLGGLWLNYAEVQGLLPKIVGAGEGMEDIHIYGFDWAWW